MNDISVLEKAEENFAEEIKDNSRLLDVANRYAVVLDEATKLNEIHEVDNEKLKARAKTLCTSLV